MEEVSPFRERALVYLDDPAQLDEVLADGAERAAAMADVTLEAAYEQIGFLPPRG